MDKRDQDMAGIAFQNALADSEHRLRLFVEAVRDYAIFQLDAAGTVRTWNAGAERMKGYTANEIIGRHFSSFYTPEDLANDKPRTELRIASETGRCEDEGWRLRKDGSRFWAHVTITAIRDSGGTLIGFAKITHDDSERRKSEQEIAKQAALLDAAHDSIIVRDLDNRITFWNRGAEQKYGWSREEALGKITHTLLKTKPRLPFVEIESELHEQRYWEGELVHTTKAGQEITVASRWVLQCDAHGNATSIFEINNDITVRKEAERALKESEAHLRALFEFAPDAIITSEPTGAISEVNSQTEKLFGYVRNELVGHKIEMLIPERFRQNHEVHRQEYNAHPHARPMGARFELYGRRRDGTEFPVDIMLATVETAKGKVVVSTIRDLSEKKKAEETIRRGEQQRQYLEEELHGDFQEIIGQNSTLRKVLKQAETVAPQDATVLILGETGTGKELVARAIHRLSRRHDRPFIKLNCAAIPSGLLESELFGHEKGAFTGAIAQKIGRLELAHQGTLFLDEVGDIPPEIQPKLLRALQEKEFERLGSTRTISVNIRLIAATNRELEKMVADKQFRSDLYYRLKVFPIAVPALRERRDDISLLVRYFVDMHARRMDKRIETIPTEVMTALTDWDWPGNVRELENFIERSVILTSGSVLRAPLAELRLDADAASEPTTSLHDAEREHILRTLRETKGRISGPGGAANRLGLKRTTLNSKIKKLSIKRSDYV